MFRHFLTASTIALITAPCFADTFTAAAVIDTVTIYPQGATILRQVTLNVPAGTHEIVVPDLPANLPPQGLRLSTADGAQIGAVNLAQGRLPVTDDQTSPVVEAAKDELERLEEVLRTRLADVAAIRLRVTAAEDQIAFLQGLSQNTASETLTAGTIADIQALARMVGSETLAARQTAFAAEEEAKEAERALKDDREAVRDAKQALAALQAPPQDGSVLTFTLGVAVAGEVTVLVSTVEGGAAWQPVYDVRLTTGEEPALDIDRGVVVSQWSGQDWNDVNLVLSTARPGEQINPGDLWPQLRRIISEEELERERQPRRMAMADSEGSSLAMAAEAPMAVMDMPAPARMDANFAGANVSYDYSGKVSIRNGVEDLRLPLDTLTMEAETWAAAVPSRDDTAFLMAEFTNSSDEILLPGQALLLVDGAMVGFDQMPIVAAGADTEMGFGPIDGIRLTRQVPNRSEGDAGVFTSANEQREAVVIGVENLTNRDWNIRVSDVIAHSEQDDLDVAYVANPAPTNIDPDGQRGFLDWHFGLPAGDRQTITLDTTITWPNGYILR